MTSTLSYLYHLSPRVYVESIKKILGSNGSPGKVKKKTFGPVVSSSWVGETCRRCNGHINEKGVKETRESHFQDVSIPRVTLEGSHYGPTTLNQYRNPPGSFVNRKGTSDGPNDEPYGGKGCITPVRTRPTRIHPTFVVHFRYYPHPPSSRTTSHTRTGGPPRLGFEELGLKIPRTSLRYTSSTFKPFNYTYP